MSDRDYWQRYRDRLSGRINLTRVSLENKFDGAKGPVDASSRLCHGSIQDIQKIREQEEHLAAVDRLLAGSGQLE